MKRWRVLACALACGLLATASTTGLRAQTPGNEAPTAAQVQSDRQVLVMLRMPAPHFRPSLAYSGGAYGSDAARVARRRIAEALARDYGLDMLVDWPMPSLGVDCFVMAARDAASVESIVERLSADPRVESAQRMNTFSVLAHNDPLYPLQQGATRWHLDELHAITTGRGVRIAEIDTGVEADHPDLEGQVELSRNLVDDRRDVAEFHGTAVAGIIAARADNNVGIVGVAPASKLLALRACWQPSPRDLGAVCTSFTLAKALQSALDERVDVINLSVGGPRDPLLGRLLDVASARGIAIVAAVDPERAASFPASYRGVLAIAEDDVQDRSANIFRAPGRDIPTTVVGRSWGFASGNSFAAAHVSGLVALLREVAPRARPAEVREFLSAASPIGVSDASPRVDACAAVAKARQGCACECGAAYRASAALY
jgi:subtilisin family serine protease